MLRVLTQQAVDIISGPMGLDLKRCQHRQRNGGVTSLRWRVTTHTQLQEQTKLSSPVASPGGIGNGLNIALSVAGALTTTLFARSTVMVKHFAVS